MPSGAAMPTRTVCPLTSRIVTKTSPPITTRSPGRRVRISMNRHYGASALASRGEIPELMEREPRVRPGSLAECEQMGLQFGAGCGVQDLMPPSLPDGDRGTEIDDDVAWVGGRAHGHIELGGSWVLGADQLAVLLGELE